MKYNKNVRLSVCIFFHVLGIPPLSEYEECMLQNAALLIKQDIDMACDFCAGKGYQTSKGICSTSPELTFEETLIPDDKCKKDYVTCQQIDVCHPCT